MKQPLVIKISGEYFRTESEGLFSESRAEVFSKALLQIKNKYSQIYIIVGGGNIVRGRKKASTIVPRFVYDEMGMTGTNINAQWLAWYLRKKNHKAIALTTGNNSFIDNFSTYMTSHDKEKSLIKPVIMIIGGGTGMSYLSTDTLTIIIALRTKAELVLFAKHGIDGVYSADPSLDPNAKLLKKTTFQKIIDEKLLFIDLPAATLALNQGIVAKVFRFKNKTSLAEVIQGKIKHTLVS